MAGFWSSAVEDLLDQVTYKAFSPMQEVYQSELCGRIWLESIDCGENGSRALGTRLKEHQMWTLWVIYKGQHNGAPDHSIMWIIWKS